jgi:hypothetical protein
MTELEFHQLRLVAASLRLCALNARRKLIVDPERGMKSLDRYCAQFSSSTETLQFMLDKRNSV